MRCPKFKKSQIFLGPPKFPFLVKSEFTFSEIPGNCSRHTICKNVIIYVFHEIFDVQFRFFPEKCRPQFQIFVEIWVPPFLKFTGIVITIMRKTQEYTCFPKSSRRKSDFSREIFTKIFSFHENLGSTFSRIPGNFGRQNN